MIKVPFTPRKRPPRIPPGAIPPEPINISGIDGMPEKGLKKILCNWIDRIIEQLLKIKARLRQPLKAADMPEIEEEGP